MQKGTILSVDDDENLQTVVCQYLEADGYKIISANNVATAIEKTDSASFDVILLDLTLPDGEGLTLISKFQEKSKAGIIIVSGKTDTTEKIVCLEMGADDYITKPFEMRELSARIKAVLRRRETSNDSQAPSPNDTPDTIMFGDSWCLNRSQYQLFDKNNVSANLTTGEFKLLEALVLSSGRALSREHLFDLTREGEFDVYDRAIDIQIARLRKKLHDDTKFPQIIRTVRGIGYMFHTDIQK